MPNKINIKLLANSSGVDIVISNNLKISNGSNLVLFCWGVNNFLNSYVAVKYIYDQAIN